MIRKLLCALAALAAVLAAAPAAGQVLQLRDAQGHPYYAVLGVDSVTGLSCIPGPSAPTCQGPFGGGNGTLGATVNVAPLSGLSDLSTHNFSLTGFGAARFSPNDPATGADIQLTDWKPTGAGITAADSGTSATTGQGGISQITGTPTANSAVTFQVNGMSNMTITAKGTFSLTSQIEGSADGASCSTATYHAVTGELLGSAGAVRTGVFTGVGSIRIVTTDYDCIRVRATAYTSGTQTISAIGTANTGAVRNIAPASPVDSAGFDTSDPVNHTWGTSPAVNSSGKTPLIQADQSKVISVGTATTLEVIPGVTAKKIYVTNYLSMSGGTGTVKFVAGTGTNCGTGQVDLTGPIDVTAQVGASPGGGIGPVLITPTAGQAICETTTSSATGKGHIAFAQF